MGNITQKQIYDKYIAYLQAQNSKINASAPFTYWSIQAGAISSTLLDLYANTDIVNKAIFIQNLQGSQIDNKLYETGLTPRGALTISVIGVTFKTDTVIPNTTITIPANTQFQTPNGIIYTLYQPATYFQPPTITPPTAPTPITLYAIIGGSGTFIGADTTLTATIPILTVPTLITAIVVTSIAGQNQESDQSCVNRLLLQQRSPTSGCRTQDYYKFAREANTAVTDVIPVFPYKTINGINSLGIFPLIGSFITEYQLNAGLLSIVYPTTTPPTIPLDFTQYSRAIDAPTLAIVNTYILSEQLLGLDVITGSCQTFTVDTNNLTVAVTLLPIYAIFSVIQIQSLDASNNVITISINIADLLQREVRRVVCNQPYGGTDLGDPTYNFITLNDIVEGLNHQLSYNNGQIAKLLLDVKVTYYDPLLPSYKDIPVPKQQFGSALNTAGTFEGIYDIIAYNTVTIIEKN